jgi:hypothetical protein
MMPAEDMLIAVQKGVRRPALLSGYLGLAAMRKGAHVRIWP